MPQPNEDADLPEEVRDIAVDEFYRLFNCEQLDLHDEPFLGWRIFISYIYVIDLDDDMFYIGKYLGLKFAYPIEKLETSFIDLAVEHKAIPLEVGAYFPEFFPEFFQSQKSNWIR